MLDYEIIDHSSGITVFCSCDKCGEEWEERIEYEATEEYRDPHTGDLDKAEFIDDFLNDVIEHWC